MKPHIAWSWKVGHASNTNDGRYLWFTVVKHEGVQVTNGFESPKDISMYCNVWILHTLEGMVPKTWIYIYYGNVNILQS